MAWWNKGQHTHHGVYEADYLATKRLTWRGWPELREERGIPEGVHLRQLVREHEREAIAMLAELGFEDIDDWAYMSNQFVVDAVATYKGQRVLVDVTSRLRHHVPVKLALAQSLRMPLYVFFLSPDRQHRYLAGPVEAKSVRVPMSYFRAQAMDAQGDLFEVVTPVDVA